MDPASSTILIVDDDPAALSTLKSFLTLYGCKPAVFPSAEAAFARPLPELPFCAILAMELPDRLSLQAALAVRWPGLPVILSSSQANAPTANEALKSGAAAFLPKPVSADNLLQVLVDACPCPSEPPPALTAA